MVVVRQVCSDDWRLWRQLRLRALAESPDAFASTLAHTIERDTLDGEDYWRGYFRRPGPTFVVDVGEIPAGMARVVAPLDEGSPADLFSVWVAPEARGTGAGRALVSAGIDWLAEHRPGSSLVLAVVESNVPARRLYGTCGFVVTGRNPDDDDELLMERPALDGFMNGSGASITR